MKSHRSELSAMTIFFVTVALLAASTPVVASTTTVSGTEAEVTAAGPDIEAARETVADLLREHGLSDDQVNQRLASLTDEDVLQLSQHADQIQEGGSVPTYIWILLAILLGVTILAAL